MLYQLLLKGELMNNNLADVFSVFNTPAIRILPQKTRGTGILPILNGINGFFYLSNLMNLQPTPQDNEEVKYIKAVSRAIYTIVTFSLLTWYFALYNSGAAAIKGLLTVICEASTNNEILGFKKELLIAEAKTHLYVAGINIVLFAIPVWLSAICFATFHNQLPLIVTRAQQGATWLKTQVVKYW